MIQNIQKALNLSVLSVVLFAGGFIWFGKSGAFNTFMTDPAVMLVTFGFVLSYVSALALIRLRQHPFTRIAVLGVSLTMLMLTFWGYELVWSVGHTLSGTIGVFTGLTYAFDYGKQISMVENFGSVNMESVTRGVLIATMITAAWICAVIAAFVSRDNDRDNNIAQKQLSLVGMRQSDEPTSTEEEAENASDDQPQSRAA